MATQVADCEATQVDTASRQSKYRSAANAERTRVNTPSKTEKTLKENKEVHTNYVRHNIRQRDPMIVKEWLRIIEENVSKQNTCMQTKYLEQVRQAADTMRWRISRVHLLDGSALAEDLENDESDSTVGPMVSIIYTVSVDTLMSHYTPTYVHTNSKGLYRSRNTCTRTDMLCMTPRKKKRLVGHGSARKLFVIMHTCMCALCHYRQHCCDSHAYHARTQKTTDAPTGDAERCKQTTDKRETVKTLCSFSAAHNQRLWFIDTLTNIIKLLRQ